MNKSIYLDNNATTSLDSRVLKAMQKDFEGKPYNPSSIHFFGRRAKNLLIKARRKIATTLGVSSDEIYFTSGGTESNNLLIRGLISNASRGHIISSDLEHSSIYETLQKMIPPSYEVTYLSGGLHGAVTKKSLLHALREDTKLIILIAVNNETGVKTDIDGIAAIANAHNIPLLLDGIAWFGKEEYRIPKGVSGLSISGHKLHAPKGVGLCYISNDLGQSSLITGGPQEKGYRAGTENLSGILGLAEAIALLPDILPEAKKRVLNLRQRLEVGIYKNLKEVYINGTGDRICNTVNIAFSDVEGEALFMNLDMEKIAVSYGSACSTGVLEPSRVLVNMGIPPNLARSSLRFSLSRLSTIDEINRTIDIVIRIVNHLRHF